MDEGKIIEMKPQPEAQILMTSAYESIINNKLIEHKLPTSKFGENAALIVFLAYKTGDLTLEDLEKFKKEMERYIEVKEVKDFKFSKIVQDEYQKLQQKLNTLGETITGGK